MMQQTNFMLVVHTRTPYRVHINRMGFQLDRYPSMQGCMVLSSRCICALAPTNGERIAQCA